MGRNRGVSLHPSAIAKIEARDASPPRAIRLNEAAALAAALGRSIDDLTQEQATLWEEAAEVATAGALHFQDADREFARALDLLSRVPESDDADGIAEARANIDSALEAVEYILEGTQAVLADLRSRIDGEHREAP